MQVLLAPDKFKGTLTAEAAARAIARGWRQVRPKDSLELLPITDGGDGFGAVISKLMCARPMRCKTVDAAHRPCMALWWWDTKTKTAIIESANIVGLAMLPPGKFHPFDLDTFGLGKVIQAAQKKGAGKILIGIGGSATNDGGFGLARAMGWRFLDARNKEITQWTELEKLHEVRPPKVKFSANIIVAVDVQNRMLGLRGATRVYGPQKGLRTRDFGLAERCLGRLVKISKAQRLALVRGTGAAGGLGFGLLTFLGAKLEPGFGLFARAAKLEHHLQSANIVITGEGAIDRSTFMGKGVGEIAGRCRKLNIACLAFAGAIGKGIPAAVFREIAVLTQMTTIGEAKANPAVWLARLAQEAARKTVD